MPMSGFETITCSHDGVAMDGFLARPASGKGPLPTVMLFPGAGGTGPTFESNVRALAEMGYLAIAMSVYDSGTDLATPQSTGAAYMGMLERPELLRARVVEWFEHVCAMAEADEARIAALGYCFGGKCVLELARSGADLRTVVSYHGLLGTHAPAQPGMVSAEVVAYCAGRDPFATMDEYLAFQSELREAGVVHQLTLFSHAQHSFTDPDHEGAAPGIAYDPQYHRVSWSSTLALLDYHLKG
jgi:dienelactone hydrolase